MRKDVSRLSLLVAERFSPSQSFTSTGEETQHPTCCTMSGGGRGLDATREECRVAADPEFHGKSTE